MESSDFVFVLCSNEYVRNKRDEIVRPPNCPFLKGWETTVVCKL